MTAEEKKKRFRAAAEALKPEIYTQTVRPQAVFVQEKGKWQKLTPKAPAHPDAAVGKEEPSTQPGAAAGKAETSTQNDAASAAQSIPLRLRVPILFDFGNHFVGRISLKLTSEGYHQDAPVFLKLKFCESKKEIDEDTSNYQGWISKAWIQEEWLHADVLPAAIEPKRRYAFRYIRIDLLAESDRFSAVVSDIFAETGTSARDADAQKLIGNAKEQALQRVSLRTLRSCMQDVFEDGPKRDRRLWIGDLRLQALANYASYQNNDLVKRCLYLFAGTCNADGRICACVFTEPETEGDETYMFDYSLFFIPTLLDYYKETGDRETALDLLETAYRQTEIAREYFDENDCMRDSDVLGWCFLDWNLALNKQAGAQAVYIYCVRAMRELICLLSEEENAPGAGSRAAVPEAGEGEANTQARAQAAAGVGEEKPVPAAGEGGADTQACAQAAACGKNAKEQADAQAFVGDEGEAKEQACAQAAAGGKNAKEQACAQAAAGGKNAKEQADAQASVDDEREAEALSCAQMAAGEEKTGAQFFSECKEQMLNILSDEIARKTAAARKYFYDKEKGLFVSGAARQVSYASQAWSVLADICTPQENVRIMKRIAAYEGAEGMVTPYMYHNYIDALLHCGLRREAYDAMIGYWGAMTDEGADTFYELFNPENPDESPYGSNVVNSYCHAWSCTPVYFIRKRDLTEDKLC